MTAKIPKHWKIKKLGDVLEIFPTASYSRSELSDEGEMQYIHYGDIHTKFDSLLEITDNTLPKISKSKGVKYETIQLGDLVMVDASEDYQGVGKSTEVIALSRYNTIAGLHTFLLRDKGEYFCLGYKGYITMSDYVKKQLYIAATGTKVYSLSKESLKLIQLPIPPLKEQEKIAEILLSCDKAIRLTTQIITQLKQRNQGLAQQLLTGEKRVKGFENSVWKEVRLGELLDYEQPTNYLVKNTDYSNEYKIPVLTAGKTFILGYTNEKEGICTNIPLILFDDFTTDSRYIDFPFKVKSSAVKLLKTKKNVNLRFIFEAMKLIKYAIGGHERHWISKYAFLTIFVPSFKEQNAIDQILDTAHQELKLYEQKLQLLQAQKKTLMQKLLTGEILTIK